VQPQAQLKGLSFVLQTRGRVPEWVQADAKRLRQILLNLLSNAVRFTERGGITLVVDARREVMRFEVVDTGIGIAPQDLERIFLPFERGSGGRRSSEPGTGLGLTITHLLTELMGGELSVHSEMGQGSTFSVRLYLREIASPKGLVVAAGAQNSDGGQQHQSLRPITGYEGLRRTLLIVDDQPIQRQMLAGMLLPLGFVLREAASGHEALESVREACPDAVLLDISMDDMDGWATATAMRQAGFTQVPIVIVSANVFENRPDHLQAAHCQAFVDKPVMESQLLDTLAKHLGLQWVQQAVSMPLPSAGQARMPPLALDASTPNAVCATHAFPEDAAWELHRLARRGHVQALREALDEWALQAPEHMGQWQVLQDLVNQFDLDEVVARLAPSLPTPEDTLDEQHT